jgi:thiosulfate reductase cytochrome b subunit
MKVTEGEQRAKKRLYFAVISFFVFFIMIHCVLPSLKSFIQNIEKKIT